jgi:hypothetical protein
MVRAYILTDREREIIKFYIEKGLRLDQFRTLKTLVNQLDLKRLDEDLKLIKLFRQKGEA